MCPDRPTAVVPLDPEVRSPRFDLTGVDISSWHSAGRGVSHLFNAMNLFFPKGELFFVNSVRHYRGDLIGTPLMERVNAFIGQEARHSREHRGYIEVLEEAGYRVKDLDVRMFNRRLSAVHPKRQLAMTVAMEHFTASIAHQALTKSAMLHGDERICGLWRWHLTEEIEHKAVAFDVFAAVNGRNLGAYWLRISAAIQVTYNFMGRLFANQRALVSQDPEISQFGAWWGTLRFLWWSPGLFLRLAPDFLAYFRPGFHPDDKDDYALAAGGETDSASRYPRR